MELTKNVAHQIVQTRTGKERKPNPFAAVINDLVSGTHTITLGKDDVLSTVLQKLRAAAATIDKSVRLEFIGGDKKTATGFHFTLVPKITRSKKDEQPAETVQEPAQEPAKPAKTAKGSK